MRQPGRDHVQRGEHGRGPSGRGKLDTRKAVSWTELFRTFLIALDPFKLVAAAGGVLVTAIGWWLMSVIFFNGSSKPRADMNPASSEYLQGEDYNTLYKRYIDDKMTPDEAGARAKKEIQRDVARYQLIQRQADTGGTFRRMPWYEDRGPNPYLQVTTVVRERSVDASRPSTGFSRSKSR